MRALIVSFAIGIGLVMAALYGAALWLGPGSGPEAVFETLPAAPIGEPSDEAPWIALPRASSASHPLALADPAAIREAPPESERMRGRYLVGPERRHFKAEGVDRSRWVRGNTAELDELYEDLVAGPARRAGSAGRGPDHPLRHHLCLSVELTGHVESAPGAPEDWLVVERVESARVLEVAEADCLR